MQRWIRYFRSTATVAHARRRLSRWQNALQHRLHAEPLEERTLLAAAPVADPGGPYTIVEGQNLTLDASGSSDADGDTLTFSWDVNGDGTFGDAMGATPTLTFAQLSNLGIDDGPDSTAITVRVDDGTGNSTDASTTLTLHNFRPAVGIFGTPALFRGEAAAFTFRARDASLVDQAGPFVYRVDWDGNGTVDQTVSGLGALVLSHQFFAVGAVNVRASVTDKDGATSLVATMPITVAEYVLRPSTIAPGRTDLVWGGTPGDDTVSFYYQGQPGAAQLHVLVTDENGQAVLRDTTVNGVDGRILAFGYDGADVLNATSLVPNRVVFYGGQGDDLLIGGVQSDQLAGQDGNDIIVGGAQAVDGNDTILGGAGRDLLIGMAGLDYIDGGVGEDLIVGERVVFANLPQALVDIQNEWVSSRTYVERVTNILGVGQGPRSNGNTFLTPLGANPTVVRDMAVDTLFGRADLDWFLLRIGEDLVGDRVQGEFATTT